MSLLPSLPSKFLHIVLALTIGLYIYFYNKTYLEKDPITTNDVLIIDTTNAFALMVDTLMNGNDRREIQHKIDIIVNKFSNNVNIPHAIIESKQNEIDSLNKILITKNIGFLFASRKLDSYEKVTKSYTERYIELNNSRKINKAYLFKLSILFFVTLFVIMMEDGYDTDFKRLQKIQLNKSIGNIPCQSCGKIFSGKILHGKNKDESINESFCSECYNEGEFINPELTSDEVINNLMESRYLKFNNKFREWISQRLFNRKKIFPPMLTKWKGGTKIHTSKIISINQKI